MTLKKVFQSLSLLLLIVSQSSFAADSSEVLSLAPNTKLLQTTLDGTLSRTLYRTEYYETTCYRTESYTDYETSCTPRYERRCSGGGQVCSPSCSEVMRDVCRGTGADRTCQSFPTRECTTSCHTESPTCDDVRVGEDCRTYPVTRERQVPYSCTQSREVPYGTEVVDSRRSLVQIKVVGDIESLTGKDQIKVSVPDGVDVSDFQVSINSIASANTHLIYLTKESITKNDLSHNSSELTAIYVINVVKKEKIVLPVSKITSLVASIDHLNFVLSGAPIDANTTISVLVEKDQLLGGYKTIANSIIPNASIIKGAISNSVIGFEYNRRPHRITLSFKRSLVGALSKNLLNTGILSTMKIENSGSMTILARFK